MFDQPTPVAEPSPPPSLLDAPETDQDYVRAYLAAQLHSSPPLSVVFRHSGWQGNRQRIYDSFYRTAQPANRKDQFQYCGAHAYVLRNVDDPSVYRIAGSCCHDRFCLPCANERAHAIALNVTERIIKRTVRFLTLTVRSENETLAELLDKLHHSFQKLRQTKLWKKCVNGGVAFLEINWSPTKQRWHPHFHVLVEGTFLPLPQLKNLWLAITGDSFVIDIRLVTDAKMAARYVAKYASKPFNNTFLTRPEQLDEAILGLKGRKLLVTFGTWRGITLASTPTEGAWINCGTLDTYIRNAASGDTHAKAVLTSLTDQNLDELYARAPPLPPTGPDQSIPAKQLTFLGTWSANGSWQDPDYP